MIKLELHPYCRLFPALVGKDLSGLAADINENGLREPIITRAGMILDGQNRYEACLLAGVEPRFEVFDGADPLGYVISRNLSRRHLDASQRAVIAAEIANIRLGENQYTKGGSANLPVSQASAAKSMGCSERSVRIAKTVKEKSPALAAEVTAGNVSLNAAAKVATQPRRRINGVVAKGPAAINQLAHRLAQKENHSPSVTLDNLAASGAYTSAPPSVTGNPITPVPRPVNGEDGNEPTPGQVCQAAFYSAVKCGKSKDECWEAAAEAVLNA